MDAFSDVIDQSLVFTRMSVETPGESRVGRFEI